MANLGNVHDEILNTIARGTTAQLPILVPNWVEEAVQWIENNYSFQYMRVFKEWNVLAATPSPHYISIYQMHPKQFRSVAIAGSDGRLTPLEGPIDPADRTSRRGGRPSAFWLDGVANMVLDAIPEEDMVIEGHLVCYTSWQPTQPTFQHYLIDRHRTLLIGRSLMIAASRLRDPRMYEIWKAQVVDALTTANVAEESLQYGGEGQKMLWTPVFPDDEFERLGGIAP